MGYELHVISTGEQSVATFVKIIGNIHPYVHYIHIRERDWTAQDHVQAIEQLDQQGVPLEKIIINDRIDIAHIANVYGVQLAYHSLPIQTVKKYFPKLMISQSIHHVEQAMIAEAAGVDRLIYGHIYETESKPDQKPRGLTALKRLVNHVKVPIIAIGGITPERVEPILQTGAQGIAVLSGILLAKDPLKAAQAYAEALNGGDC